METIEKVLLVFIGWLLGLLGPAIVDHIKRKRENALGRTAILTELHDLSGVLSVAVHAVKMKQGTLDRVHLQWLKDVVETGNRSEEFDNWRTSVNTQLTWSDEEIAVYARAAIGKGGTATVLQKYPVPLLDSRVSALWSFDTDFQRRLLEIRQIMHRLDDLVDRSRKLHDMTFSNMDDVNRVRINENIRETALFYAQTATRAVEKIMKLRGNGTQ